MIDHLDKICIVAYAANRAWCIVNEDHSNPDWNEITDEKKANYRNGVKFHLIGPVKDASASHENWMQDKKRNGWTYGLVKNGVKKTHPCMLQFELLPPEQKIKDAIFAAIVYQFRA